jgi:16S rRNA (cytosine1402-N4)-methyltransferase
MGGHSALLLQRFPHTRVLGIDRDQESLALASERLVRFGERFRAVVADYRDIVELVRGLDPPAGVLADLGISSHQLDSAERGFAFSTEAQLDMRMDRTQRLTAARLVNETPEAELANIIHEYGEEPRARRIARAICRERAQAPIGTTTRLAEIVARASGIPRYRWRIHPATRTFQALRIAVNSELEGLDRFIEDAVSILKSPGGRLAVIAFHSLEDRIVKRTLKALSGICTCPPGLPECRCGRRRLVRLLHRRPVTPSEVEMADNPRSRSAKLRGAERL